MILTLYVRTITEADQTYQGHTLNKLKQSISMPSALHKCYPHICPPMLAKFGQAGVQEGPSGLYATLRYPRSDVITVQ